MPISDVEQMLINDLRRIDRAIEARKKDLESLRGKIAKNKNTLLRKRPAHYSLTVSWKNGEGDGKVLPRTTTAIPKSNTFTVEGASCFYAQTVASTMRVTGTSKAITSNPSFISGGQVVDITVPWGSRGDFRSHIFDAFVTVRDSASGREWWDQPIPLEWLMTGALSPLWLPVPARLPGGTIVEGFIDPIKEIIFDDARGPFVTINSLSIQLSFHGWEVAE